MGKHQRLFLTRRKSGGLVVNLQKLVGLSFWLSLAAFFSLPPIDPDLGWQLRCGQIIKAGQGFCQTNQFSVLLPNYHWPNHYSLYQLTIAAIFDHFGLWGLTIANSLIVSLTFWFFSKSIRNYSTEKILIIVLTIGLGWGVFSLGLRGQLLGLFFLSSIFWLLGQSRQNHRWLYGLPLVTTLWANCHGSVVLGVFLTIILLLNQLRKYPQRKYLIITIILFSLAATLLNPSAGQIYPEAWRHLGGVDLSQLIAEWVPPPPMVGLAVITIAFGLFFHLLESQPLITLGLIPVTYLALTARRHVPLFLITAGYFFLTTTTTRQILKPWLAQRILRQVLTLVIITGLIITTLTTRLPQTIKTNRSLADYDQQSAVVYPTEAIKFLKNQPSPGPLFNRYEWGGYLIWQLPKFPIFVDGRMPTWETPSSKSPYTIYLETLQTQPGWEETLTEYQIDWILISPGTFMDLLLQPEPRKFGWEEVYRDQVAVIYSKI